MKEEKALMLINEEIKSIKSITTETNGLIVFTKIEETKESLLALVDKHKDFTVTDEDVKNPEKRVKKLKDAKDFRAEVRQPRYDLQNMVKHNKKVLNNMKNDFEQTVSELLDILKSTEDKIQSGIIQMEEQVVYEREEKKRKEEEERNRVNDMILKVTAELPQIYENCISLRNPKNYTDALNDLKKQMDEGFFGEVLFKAEELYYRHEDKVMGLNDRIKKAKEQDESEKAAEVEKENRAEEHKKIAQERMENYKILLDTVEILGGDIALFDLSSQTDVTAEQFEIIRNEINRLKNPAPIEEPETEKEVPTMVPSQSFEKEVSAPTAEEAVEKLDKALPPERSELEQMFDSVVNSCGELLPDEDFFSKHKPEVQRAFIGFSVRLGSNLERLREELELKA